MAPAHDWFVAVPMSSLPPEEYRAFKRFLGDFVVSLGGNSFCAALQNTAVDFTDPAEAYRADTAAIRASRRFMLIHLGPTNSSTIHEFGYADALGLPIVVFVKARADLPYMLREADKATDGRIRIHLFESHADIARMVGELATL